MSSRAERRRELRAAGYHRSADKRGRRGSTRVPVLEETAVLNATMAAIADREKEAARTRRIVVPGTAKGEKKTESGIIVPVGK